MLKPVSSRVPRSSDDDEVAIVGAGITVHEALKAADMLAGEGIAARVIDLYSIKPEDAARLYGMLKPRIDEAYAELGQPNTTFDQTLERAIVVLLSTPIPAGPIPVEPNGAAVAFRYAEPALEKLTPAQKLLIRFGPENQRTVQTALRNIALALNIPKERLP